MNSNDLIIEYIPYAQNLLLGLIRPQNEESKEELKSIANSVVVECVNNWDSKNPLKSVIYYHIKEAARRYYITKNAVNIPQTYYHKIKNNPDSIFTDICLCDVENHKGTQKALELLESLQLNTEEKKYLYLRLCGYT